jgi:hypothetical protein
MSVGVNNVSKKKYAPLASISLSGFVHAWGLGSRHPRGLPLGGLGIA